MQLSQRSILLYSAQAVVRLDLMDMLQQERNLRTLPFSSTAAALAALQTGGFSAAFIDVSGDSLEMAGLQILCSGLRAQSVPFALLAPGEDLPAGICLPAQDHLVLAKPVQEPVLHATMQKLLAKAAPF